MTAPTECASTRWRPTTERRRRACRTLAAVSLFAAATFTTACGAGQVSQTADQVPAVDGNEAHAGRILLRDVRFDYPGAPGADPAYTNKQGGNAVLLFSAVNNSADTPDTLTSISTDVGTVKITSPEGNTPTLPPQQTVVAGRPVGEAPVGTDAAAYNAAASPIQVEVDNLSRPLVPGLTTDVRFTFARNGSVDVPVPVDAANAPRQVSPKSPGDS